MGICVEPDHFEMPRDENSKTPSLLIFSELQQLEYKQTQNEKFFGIDEPLKAKNSLFPNAKVSDCEIHILLLIYVSNFLEIFYNNSHI